MTSPHTGKDRQIDRVLPWINPVSILFHHAGVAPIGDQGEQGYSSRFSGAVLEDLYLDRWAGQCCLHSTASWAYLLRLFKLLSSLPPAAFGGGAYQEAPNFQGREPKGQRTWLLWTGRLLWISHDLVSCCQGQTLNNPTCALI